MDNVLRWSQSHRRLFIFLLFVLFVLLIVIDVFVLHGGFKTVQLSASGIVRNLIAAIATSAIVAVFYLVFVAPEQPSETLKQLAPSKITREFDRLLTDAIRWRYKGNFGRYLRGKVLPTLASRQNVDIDVSVIDPRDVDLCERHARYRNEIPGIDRGRNYTHDLVALEVLVTILHCAWHAANRDLSIDLYLSRVFDPIRIDTCDTAMILTVEDRRSPALLLTSSHFMYSHFEQHMRYTRDQGTKIDLAHFPRRLNLLEVSVADVTAFFNRTALADVCENVGADRILVAARNVTNPYET
ncbi:MAG: hypothetical protein WD044_16245 [Dongiaceae bacterium]